MLSNAEINKKFEILMDYEKSNKSENFVAKNINYWALIRSELQFNILRTKEQKSYQPNSPLLNSFTKIKYKYKAKYLLNKVKKNIKKQHFNSSKVLLFSSENSYYTDKIEEKLYNRHLDPLFEILNKKNISCQKLHLLTVNELDNKFYPATTIQLNNKFKEYLWLSAYQKKNNPIENNNLFNQLQINSYILNKRFHLIITLKEIFKIVLKKIEPQTIGVVCFYDDYSFALILAAKELNIPTFDIQHGKQGEQHFCYSHLVNTNKKNKNLLPNYFFNWGQSSVDNLQHFLQNKADIQTVIIGNLWLLKWKNTNFYTPTIQEKKFIENTKNYKKVFLYGAQPLTDYLIPNFFLEIIKENKDLLFCIRLHPRSKALLEYYKQELKDYSNIEIEISTSAPLYFLLNKVNCVVTRWSSLALEALYSSCQSIVIDEVGAESFKQYIDRGDISLILNKQEFANFLKSKQEIKKHTDVSILLNEESILNSIEKFFA